MARRLTVNQFSRLKFSVSESEFDTNKDATVLFWGLEDIPEVEEQTGDTVYEVKDGDRLDQLSFRFYGTSALDWVIAVANNLDQPDIQLVPGLTIRIPDSQFVRTTFVR